MVNRKNGQGTHCSTKSSQVNHKKIKVDSLLALAFSQKRGFTTKKVHKVQSYILASVRLWKFKDGGSLNARCGDQVSRISFDFLKWRSMGPQKLATIIGHKYSIFKPSKKIKVFFNHKN